MKKILLDTNAYSSFLKGDEKVLEIIGESDLIYLSVFVLAELFYGFKSGTREKNNKNNLKKFLRKPGVSILEATVETSGIFANVKFSLRKSGNPLPINDVWIASHVIESGSELITFDHHFLKVSGLRLWDGIN